LLDQGNGLTLIDTLFDADARRILAQLQAIGKTVQDIKYITLTHTHRSHLGGLARLKELSGAPVYAHEWEADIESSAGSLTDNVIAGDHANVDRANRIIAGEQTSDQFGYSPGSVIWMRMAPST
jgi:glyoxylase-like metal-dependent hydrolase (beta-lactamase superfamily II)